MADEFLNLLGKLIQNTNGNNGNNGNNDRGMNADQMATAVNDSRYYQIGRYPRASSLNSRQTPSATPILDYFPEDKKQSLSNSVQGYDNYNTPINQGTCKGPNGRSDDNEILNRYSYRCESENKIDQTRSAMSQLIPDSGTDISKFLNPSTSTTQLQYSQANLANHQSTYSPPAALQSNNSEPVIDPSTIVTYSNAVKYIVSTVSRNEYIMKKIKKLIAHQDQHEIKWKQGRDQLIKRQEGRQAGKEKLESILKLVGGAGNATSSQKAENQLAENQKELDAYDLRIYNFLEQMVQDMTLKLKSYGIPLFCIQETLITDKTQLEEDRKKILDLLVDICQ